MSDKQLPSGDGSDKDRRRVSDKTPTLAAIQGSDTVRYGEQRLSPACENEGRYAHVSEYAQGGLGRVLLVHDRALERDIALKELKAPQAASDDATLANDSDASTSPPLAERFWREARITGQLEHPAIVPVHELGKRTNGTPYYTMKLVKGDTLEDAIFEARFLAKRLHLLSHFLDLCHAIAYAHSRDILHRDIKPPNVMIGEFGETVVIDWGLATKTKSNKDVQGVKKDSTIQGTPAFMAPEQALGMNEQIDERTDVYALGAVLYNILTGHAPHEDTSSEDTLKAVVSGPPKPVREHEPNAPGELVAICEHAMQRRQAQRYASAKDLAADVSAYISGGIVGAYNYTYLDHMRRAAARHVVPLVTAMVFTVLLIVVGVVYQFELVAQRNTAVHESQVADQARSEAERERQVADQARSEAEMENYFVTIGLVESSLNSFGRERPRELLKTCPSKLKGWEWGHLAYRLNMELFSTKAHDELISGLSIRGDETRIASGDITGKVCLWEIPTGKKIFEWTGIKQVRSMEKCDEADIVAAGMGEGTIHVWNFENGEELITIDAHNGPVTAISFSRDGKRLVSGGWDFQIHIWDLATGKKVKTLLGHEGSVKGLGFVPGTDRLVSVSDDSTVRYWDCKTGEIILTTPFEATYVGNLAIDPLGRYIAISASETAIILEAQSGVIATQLFGHIEMVRHVHFTPDGRSLLTVGHDLMARLWETGTWRVQMDFAPHEKTLARAQYSASGDHLATAGDDGIFKLWDSRALDMPLRGKPHRFGLQALACCNARGLLATGGGDGRVLVWNMDTGDLLKMIDAHEGTVRAIAFEPKGQGMATVGYDGDIHLWKPTAASPHMGTIPTGLSWPQDLAYSPSGTFLAAYGQPSQVKIWNTAENEIREVLEGYSSFVFLPDGISIALGMPSGGVEIYNLQEAKRVSTFANSDSRVTSIQTDAQGILLATGHANGIVQVWDTARGECLSSFESGTAIIRGLAFDPLGNRLATACEDGTVRLWAPLLAREVLTLKTDSQPTRTLCFSPDGKEIFAGTVAGNLLIWAAVPWDKDMTAKEYQDYRNAHWSHRTLKYIDKELPLTQGPMESHINVRRDLLVSMFKSITSLIERLGYTDAPVRGAALVGTPGLEFLQECGFEERDTVKDLGDDEFENMRAFLRIQHQLEAGTRDTATFRLLRDDDMYTLHFRVTDL